MKYRLIALWRLLTCKSFWVITKTITGKTKRINSDFDVPDMQNMIADAENAIFTVVQQEENLKVVNKIISE